MRKKWTLSELQRADTLYKRHGVEFAAEAMGCTKNAIYAASARLRRSGFLRRFISWIW